MNEDEQRQLERAAVLEGYKAVLAGMVGTLAGELMMYRDKVDETVATFKINLAIVRQAPAIALAAIG